MNIQKFRDKSLHSTTKIPKRTQHNWPDPGDMGEFMLVSKTDLCIDLSYQRERVSKDKVLKIASEWDWQRFGTLSIMLRDGKTPMVVNGGHRFRASELRDDIDMLPCMVFDGKSRKGEARKFLEIHLNRNPVTAYQKYHAALAAHDPIALTTRSMMNRYGYTANEYGRGLHTTKAIGLVQAQITENPIMAEKAFKLAVEISDNSQPVEAALLRGIFYLLKNLQVDIAGNPFRRKLINAGNTALLRMIRTEKAVLAGGGQRVEGLALLHFLNKGRRAHNRIMFG